jgi:cytochrome c biogenesis protein CcmG, thiol:disulfide interchange protein DsbE
MNMKSLKHLSLAVGLFMTLGSIATAQIKVGDSFPDLKSFKLEGTLPSSLAGKVVFVDFWASWCNPCRESFPVLNELSKKYADRGLVIVGVNLDESKADMDRFLKEHPAQFTVVRDASESVVKKLAIRTFPSSYIIDGQGKVHFVHSGFHGDKTKKQYIEEIESLLGK